MNRLKIVFFSLFCWCCKHHQSDPFALKINRLFFNADLTASYKNVVHYYENLESSFTRESGGWTFYPPLSALGDNPIDSSLRSFQFDFNPNMPSEFGKGEINIRRESMKEDAKCTFDMAFFFTSKINADRAFNAISSDFNEYKQYKKEMQTGNITANEFDNPNDGYPGIAFFMDSIDYPIKEFTIKIIIVKKGS